MEQRSAEWLAAKCGKVGCSRLGDVLAVSKRTGEPLQARIDYLMELVVERLTGLNSEHFTTDAMEWGIMNEAAARTEYEARLGTMVEEDGGMECKTIPGFWCSPDGLVDGDGGLEIKCPNTATHLATLIDDQINPRHILQMAGGCLIYERSWWDFVSYDPRLPKDLSFYCKRFKREELPIDAIAAGVSVFLQELSELQEKIANFRGTHDAP